MVKVKYKPNIKRAVCKNLLEDFYKLLFINFISPDCICLIQLNKKKYFEEDIMVNFIIQGYSIRINHNRWRFL